MTRTNPPKIERLTEQTLRNLPLPEIGETTYTITYTRGLTVRVRSSGCKSFYARLWNPQTKKVLRRKLGNWPELSCSLAIKALEKFKRDLQENKWEGKLVRYSLTQAYQYYRERKEKEGRSTSFLQQIDQAWRCIPNDLQSMLLDDVPLHRLADLVSDVATQRKGTAFHVRRLLKAIYKLSLINEWCTKDRTLTVAPIKLQPKRLLVSNEEISKVLNVARQHPDKHKVCALLLCAATGQRGAEIMRLRWENIFEEIIVLPAEIRKQRTEHTVWLNELACEALSYLSRGAAMAHR